MTDSGTRQIIKREESYTAINSLGIMFSPGGETIDKSAYLT